MAQITYTNKETLNSQPSIADKNKVTSNDMNEIKLVVNTNYEEVGDITNLTTPDKTSIVNAINSMQGTILWTNPNPSSDINTLNIMLSSDDYDELLIWFKLDKDLDYIGSQKLLKGYGAILETYQVANNSVYHRYRYINRSSDTSFALQNGYQQKTNDSTVSTSSRAIIPIYIVGYKTGLF